MLGHTWKNIESSTAEKIKQYLLENGGEEQKVGSTSEKWRVKFSDSTFTYYEKGTLYSTESKSNDPTVLEVWKFIDSLVVSYMSSTKDFLIGFDETGKGEVVGHMVLTGVVFPKEIFGKINLLVGPADTKKRHEFKYWDDVFRKLDYLGVEGLYVINEKEPPWQIDRYNLNKIMDVTYQRILNIFFRKVQINRCRIVLDDYGIGPTLKRFLTFLERQGAEVIVTRKAEDQYLEVKTASLISKRMREAVLKSINENPDFKIDGLIVGSGNAGDPKTIEWLEKWHAFGKEWPWFVKRSFKNVKTIEKKSEKSQKIAPTIREDLLSREFLEDFNKGRLSANLAELS